MLSPVHMLSRLIESDKNWLLYAIKNDHSEDLIVQCIRNVLDGEWTRYLASRYGWIEGIDGKF